MRDAKETAKAELAQERFREAVEREKAWLKRPVEKTRKSKLVSARDVLKGDV